MESYNGNRNEAAANADEQPWAHGAQQVAQPPLGAIPRPAYPQGPQGRYAAPTPRQNSPFAGIKVTDYVRDGVSAVLLFLALFLPWSQRFEVTGKGNGGLIALAVLITLLSIGSIALPYAARLGLLGAQWHSGLVRILRLVFNGPYLLLALSFVLWDLVESFFQFKDSPSMGPGTGPGLWFGVAGAILAAQPRSTEIDTGSRIPAGWLKAGRIVMFVALGYACISGLESVAVVLRTASKAHEYGGSGADTVKALAAVALLVALAVSVVAVSAIGFVRHFAQWRLTVIAFSAAILIAGFFVAFDGDKGIEQFGGGLFMATILLVAVGVCAQVPGAEAISQRQGEHGGYTWLAAARSTFLLIAVWSIGYGIAVLGVAALLHGPVGETAAITVFSILIGALALVGRQLLKPHYAAADPRPSREVAIGISVGIVLLSIARMITNSAMHDTIPMMTMDLVVPLLAVTVAVTMAAAPQIRALYKGVALFPAITSPTPAPGGVVQTRPYGSMNTSTPAQHTNPSAAVAAVSAQGQQPSPSGYGFTTNPSGPATLKPSSPDTDTAAAIDPNTSPAELARIAYARSDLRPAVASHPAAYPALVQWLADLGDPAVDKAIRLRG